MRHAELPGSIVCAKPSDPPCDGRLSSPVQRSAYAVALNNPWDPATVLLLLDSDFQHPPA
jgi:hypothetical protein